MSKRDALNFEELIESRIYLPTFYDYSGKPIFTKEDKIWLYRSGQLDDDGKLEGIGFKLFVSPSELKGQLLMGFFKNDSLECQKGYKIYSDGRYFIGKFSDGIPDPK